MSKKQRQLHCEFTIDEDAFEETSTKKITGMRLIIEYENPQAYGYPEVCGWEREFEFNIKKIKNNIEVCNG